MIILLGVFTLQSGHEYASKYLRGDNSNSIKAIALSFVRDTYARPVPHNCEVSSTYYERYSSCREDTKMFTDGHMTDGRKAHR